MVFLLINPKLARAIYPSVVVNKIFHSSIDLVLIAMAHLFQR